MAHVSLLAADEITIRDFRHQHWRMTDGKISKIFPTVESIPLYDAKKDWSARTPVFPGVTEVLQSSEAVFVRSPGMPSGSSPCGPWPAFAFLPEPAFYTAKIPLTGKKYATDYSTGGRDDWPKAEGMGNYRFMGISVDGVPFLSAHRPDDSGRIRVMSRREVQESDANSFAVPLQFSGGSGVTGALAYVAGSPSLRIGAGDSGINQTWGHWGTPPHETLIPDEKPWVASHSPIIGWAFDGLPIYGPYGYENPFPDNPEAEESVKMRPGFLLREGYRGTVDLREVGREAAGPPAWLERMYPGLTADPPPIDDPNYPLGTLAWDYAYAGDGLKRDVDGRLEEYVMGEDYDLNEFGARWCATPEFPEGTWAYFVQLDWRDRPTFPYIGGMRSILSTEKAALWHGDTVKTFPEPVLRVLEGGVDEDLVLRGQIADHTDMILRWSGIEGAEYVLERSLDLETWAPFPVSTGRWEWNPETWMYEPVVSAYFVTRNDGYGYARIPHVMGTHPDVEQLSFYRLRRVGLEAYQSMTDNHVFSNIINEE